MKKAIGIVIGALVVLIVAVGLVFAGSVLKLSYYQIKTGSMTPDYPIGTLVVDSGSVHYQKNHAITFVADGKVVTHYFRGYNPDGSMITRGIANPTNDHWKHEVFPKDVKGTVLFQFKAFAPSIWQGRNGILAAGGFLLLIVAVLLLSIYGPESDKSTEGKLEQSATAV